MGNEITLLMDGKTVLFVDDEVKILTSLERVLYDEPYNTLFAGSGKEAMEVLRTQEVHVIVSDMKMPEMNGLELLKTVKEKYPHITRMVLSGYTDMNTLLTAVNEGEIFRFIPKPWESSDQIKAIMGQAIDFYDLNGEREILIDFFEQWIDEMDPDSEKTRFLQKLLTGRKNRLDKANRKDTLIPAVSK